VSAQTIEAPANQPTLPPTTPYPKQLAMKKGNNHCHVKFKNLETLLILTKFETKKVIYGHFVTI
jgi:hypothetical protein